MKNFRRILLGLPDYTLGEELMNSISHGVGALLGVVALVLCIIKPATTGNSYGVVAGAVYGSTLIMLYTMSSLYHALKVNRAKRVFQTFDHCSIFLLIAGTYTPISLVALKGALGWTLFGIIWAVAIMGITLNAISVKKYAVLSMICYIAMGWVIVFVFPALIKMVPRDCIRLLFWGGIAYTLGAVLYGLGKRGRYIHSIWHVFVLAGSILHFFSIYLYVL